LSGLLVLRESRPPALAQKPFDRGVLHPLAPLRWAAGFPALLPMLGVFLVLVLVGEVAGTTWVLTARTGIAWNGTTVGLSLAGFGLIHAVVQGFVAGPLVERWGERAAIAIGTALRLHGLRVDRLRHARLDGARAAAAAVHGRRRAQPALQLVALACAWARPTRAGCKACSRASPAWPR
jgi:MFS family permease